jgi:hypothetical protein
MIEKKIEYRIIEFVFNRKLNLYSFIVLLLLSLIFFSNTLYSFYFGIPFFIMYELLILLFNYNKIQKYLCYLLIGFFMFIFVFGLFSTSILNFIDLYLIIFIFRFKFYFINHFNKEKNWFDFIYCLYILTPLFIHTQKEKILNLIKVRYYKNE